MSIILGIYSIFENIGMVTSRLPKGIISASGKYFHRKSNILLALFRVEGF